MNIFRNFYKTIQNFRPNGYLKFKSLTSIKIQIKSFEHAKKFHINLINGHETQHPKDHSAISLFRHCNSQSLLQFTFMTSVFSLFTIFVANNSIKPSVIKLLYYEREEKLNYISPTTIKILFCPFNFSVLISLVYFVFMLMKNFSYTILTSIFNSSHYFPTFHVPLPEFYQPDDGKIFISSSSDEWGTFLDCLCEIESLDPKLDSSLNNCFSKTEKWKLRVTFNAGIY